MQRVQFIASSRLVTLLKVPAGHGSGAGDPSGQSEDVSAHTIRTGGVRSRGLQNRAAGHIRAFAHNVQQCTEHRELVAAAATMVAAVAQGVTMVAAAEGQVAAGWVVVAYLEAQLVA